MTCASRVLQGSASPSGCGLRYSETAVSASSATSSKHRREVPPQRVQLSPEALVLMEDQIKPVSFYCCRASEVPNILGSLLLRRISLLLSHLLMWNSDQHFFGVILPALLWGRDYSEMILLNTGTNQVELRWPLCVSQVFLHISQWFLWFHWKSPMMFMLLPPYLTLGSLPLNSLYRWSSPPLESPRWSSDHHDVAAKHLLELPRHLRCAASGRGLQSHAPGGERRSRFLEMVGDHRDCCLDQQKISKKYMGIVVIKPTCWFLSLKPFLWFSVSWRFVKMYCVRFWSQQLGKELKFLEEPSGENWTDWASKVGPNSR